MQPKPPKPTLRGYFHQEAFFVGLGACAILIARSSNQKTLIASLVYSFSVLFLFGMSAIYHRIHWEPKPRSVLKRVDHSAIFLLIAGTTTPVALFTLPETESVRLLWVVWIATLIGIAQSILWVKAPKWVTALLYVIVGWICLPYFSEIKASLNWDETFFLVAGGVVYTVGALFYAFKRPNWFPGVFGYHEFFHIFTVIAAAFHFVVVYNLIARA